MLTGSHALLCPAARHDTQIKQSNQIQFYHSCSCQNYVSPSMENRGRDKDTKRAGFGFFFLKKMMSDVTLHKTDIFTQSA